MNGKGAKMCWVGTYVQFFQKPSQEEPDSHLGSPDYKYASGVTKATSSFYKKITSNLIALPYL
jgi:hypothetical protein